MTAATGPSATTPPPADQSAASTTPSTRVPPRVLRHASGDELVQSAAQRLLDQLVRLQANQETVHLCLAGGSTANRVYEAFADLVPGSSLDPGSLHLWWGDEPFVPTTDPERNSLQNLSILARTLQMNASQTHPMPASDGKADADEAAYAYAQELGEVVFDLCLLGMGADGGVAAIYPHHPSFEPTSALAFGVSDSPTPPTERISLGLEAINRSRRVWLWVDGTDKAETVAQALTGDEQLPASQVAGQLETLWFLGPDAASRLPVYHCAY